MLLKNRRILIFRIRLFFSVHLFKDNIITAWAIRYHCDRYFNLFFYKLNILTAVLWKICVVLDSADICLPAWKLGKYRFSLFKLCSSWEVSGHFAVDLIANANRDLI